MKPSQKALLSESALKFLGAEVLVSQSHAIQPYGKIRHCQRHTQFQDCREFQKYPILAQARSLHAVTIATEITQCNVYVLILDLDFNSSKI